MNAKEKSKELTKKFLDATLAHDSGDHSVKGINDSILAMVAESKRCAIICVDEILKEYDEIYKNGWVNDYPDNVGEKTKFYNEVKKEIELI